MKLTVGVLLGEVHDLTYVCLSVPQVPWTLFIGGWPRLSKVAEKETRGFDVNRARGVSQPAAPFLQPSPDSGPLCAQVCALLSCNSSSLAAKTQ